MEPRGRRRPDLCANIRVSVLQVPAGKEGEPEGLPNFIKEENRRSFMRIRRAMMRMRMRRRWRGREGMRRTCRTLGGGGEQDGKIGPLTTYLLPLIPCISYCKVLSAKKKLNNHIVEMPKDPASCILC